MFVLFVFYIAEAIKLTDFGKFTLNLDANATEYFKFQGNFDHAYLYQKNRTFEFWLIRNESHRLYQSPYSNTLSFEWPEFKINGEEMKLVLYEGNLDEPYDFDYEVYLTSIHSIYASNLTQTTIERLYKCRDYTEWIIYGGIFIVFTVFILLKHESIPTVLRPLIPWFIRWSRTLLSRGQEEIPRN